MRLLITTIFFCIFTCCNTIAATSLTISSGTGLDETLIQSGNISSTTANGLLFNTNIANNLNLFSFNFDMNLEIAGYQLKGRHNDLDEEMDIFHIKPKVRWDSESNYHIDVGLGIATISEQKWEEITFSGTTQFALSVGIGLDLGADDQLSVDLVYNHYSNGYTRSPNPGLDFLTLNIGYKF